MTSETVNRQHTHGSAFEQFGLAQRLKREFRNWGQLDLDPVKAEALDMIAVKISRILTGNGDFEDHWEDIAGYAMRAIGK